MTALGRIAAEAEFLHLLVDQLRPSVRDGHTALVKLLEHIAGMVGGHAVVITPDARVIGRGDIPSVLLQAHRSAAATRVRDGELSAASVVLAGSHFQIVGIGDPRPRPVIVVACRTPYPSWMADLVNYAAVALAASSTLSRALRVDHERAPAVQTAPVAILSHLMVGNVTAARRLAHPLLPGVLDTSPVRVFVIECPQGRRALCLEACQRTLADAALASADPHRHDRVVVVAPAARSPHTDEVRRMVKDLVAAQSLGAAGESGPVGLDRIRAAHEMAALALAVARRQPERIARYSDGRQLAHLLADSGASWARACLKPLSTLSDEERDGLLPVVRQVLHSGHGAAAETIGLNRKTVAARWNRAGSVLRLDLRDMRVRAELNLALELVRATASGTEPSPALSLGEILATPVALAWAQEFTAPLRRDARPLLRTVTAWISANGRIEECAERLDAHPNTVRNHLGACERLLGRRLVGRSGGANDLVIALLVQPAARRGR